MEQLLKEAAAEVQTTEARLQLPRLLLFGLSFVAAREARVTQAQEASTAACQRGIDAEAAPEDILQAGAQKALLHATEHVAFVRLCCAVLC